MVKRRIFRQYSFFDYEGLMAIHRPINRMILIIRIKLLVAILLLFSIGINAQSLKGRLLDLTNNRPLRRASVNLTSLKDSTQKFNTISDSSGRFEFKNLYTDSFVLRISFVGYDDFKQIVGINNGTVDLGTLFIPRSIKAIGRSSSCFEDPAGSTKRRHA